MRGGEENRAEAAYVNVINYPFLIFSKCTV